MAYPWQVLLLCGSNRIILNERNQVKINTSGYDDALRAATFDPILGLYSDNASTPLRSRQGLRELYLFGLYSYCAYTNETSGSCGNQTIGNQFRPYEALTMDMRANYSTLTDGVFDASFHGSDATFRNSSYLGSSTKAAYWLILLGTICAGLALITGVLVHNFTFLLSTALAIIGSLMLLIAAAIWTVIIKKAEGINDFVIGSNDAPLGIVVSGGIGLSLLWAAFACLLVSCIPYMIACCTFR
ncbi:hypothetical protein HGRIS_007493 [Hohenbuehelia grisea]|uniref:Uncharacterized protein n=1 Tax=Hohenbuehelia grisea TaxID=104357 RepID=A0ABR3J5E0_9AGAR